MEQVYEIIAKSFIDYYDDELKIIRDNNNDIIILDNKSVREYNCWEDFVNDNEIISNKKIYNLYFNEIEIKQINKLLKLLNLSLL